MNLLTEEEIKHFKTHQTEITSELLETLRAQGKTGKSQALEILDLPKTDDQFYLDAYGEKIGYMGDRTSKRSYTKLPLSKIHFEEIERCYNDPMHFIRNYVKVMTPKGIDFLDFRKYQERFLQMLINPEIQNLLALQPRQCVAQDTKLTINNSEITIKDFFEETKSGFKQKNSKFERDQGV